MILGFDPYHLGPYIQRVINQKTLVIMKEMSINLATGGFIIVTQPIWNDLVKRWMMTYSDPYGTTYSVWADKKEWLKEELKQELFVWFLERDMDAIIEGCEKYGIFKKLYRIDRKSNYRAVSTVGWKGPGFRLMGPRRGLYMENREVAVELMGQLRKKWDGLYIQEV